MGLWARALLLFRGKTSAALDRAEDPRQVLDYAYHQQQEVLLKVGRGLVEVASSRVQLEQQSRRLRERIPRCEEQARRALGVGREDLARVALQRKHTALAELDALEPQVAEVEQEEARLAGAQRELSARVEEFKDRRTVLSARYTAARARVRVSEALTGVSGELAELNMALGRAGEKTERLQASCLRLGRAHRHRRPDAPVERSRRPRARAAAARFRRGGRGGSRRP